MSISSDEFEENYPEVFAKLREMGKLPLANEIGY
jgi:hypothetical protein